MATRKKPSSNKEDCNEIVHKCPIFFKRNNYVLLKTEMIFFKQRKDLKINDIQQYNLFYKIGTTLASNCGALWY